MSNNKIAVVGDRDSVLGFKALGLGMEQVKRCVERAVGADIL